MAIPFGNRRQVAAGAVVRAQSHVLDLLGTKNACVRLSLACRDRVVASTVEMRVGTPRRRFGGVRIAVMVSLDCGGGTAWVWGLVLWPLG